MSQSNSTTPRTSEWADYDLLAEIRRGLCQEYAGMKEQMQGKRQQINAVERKMEKMKATRQG